MTKWYDRIENTIEMYVDGEWIRGKIINGYRTCDGLVNMKAEDGKTYWCGVGCEGFDFRKADDSFGDLINNADRIKEMTISDLASFLCKVKADYQWKEQEFPSEDEVGEWEEWLKEEIE